MRIAIFGGGSIGQRHAANLRKNDVLTCVLDVDPARGAAPETFDPRWPDAVIIATPAATHEAVATTLLDCGYSGPLFVEKPLALRSAAPVFRDWPHPVTMVGYNWRFHPELQLLAGVMATGGTVHLDMKTDIRTWPGAGYSNPLLECTHELDLACAWLGGPTSVHGGSLDVGRGAWVQMRHQSLAGVATDSIVDLRWHRQPASRTYTFHPFGGSTILARIATGAEAVGVAVSYQRELDRFLDMVRDAAAGVRLIGSGCSFADGLRVIEICERVKELIA